MVTGLPLDQVAWSYALACVCVVFALACPGKDFARNMKMLILVTTLPSHRARVVLVTANGLSDPSALEVQPEV